jgi:hypothetical protein
MPVSQSRQENAATKKIKNIALTEIAQRISRLEMTAAGDSAGVADHNILWLQAPQLMHTVSPSLSTRLSTSCSPTSAKGGA